MIYLTSAIREMPPRVKRTNRTALNTIAVHPSDAHNDKKRTVPVTVSLD